MFPSSVFPDDSSSVPRQCGAWGMVSCAWPYMHTHAHPYACLPSWNTVFCYSPPLHRKNTTVIWQCRHFWLSQCHQISHPREFYSGDAQWTACCDPALGCECSIWHHSSERFLKKPKHYWYFGGFISESLFPVLCYDPHNRSV